MGFKSIDINKNNKRYQPKEKKNKTQALQWGGDGSYEGEPRQEQKWTRAFLNKTWLQRLIITWTEQIATRINKTPNQFLKTPNLQTLISVFVGLKKNE